MLNAMRRSKDEHKSRCPRRLAGILAALMLLSPWDAASALRAEAIETPAAEPEADASVAEEGAEAVTAAESAATDAPAQIGEPEASSDVADAEVPEVDPTETVSATTTAAGNTAGSANSAEEAYSDSTANAAVGANAEQTAKAGVNSAVGANSEQTDKAGVNSGVANSGTTANAAVTSAQPESPAGPGVFLLADGRTYVLDAQGRKHSGWLDVPGLGRAYGEPGTGRAYMNGTYEIEGTHYVFDAWGYLAQDQWQYEKDAQSWSYAQDSGAAMRQGSREVGGQRYVFDEDAYLRGGRWIFDEIIQSWTYGDPRTALAYRDGTYVIDGRGYDFSRNGYRNDYDYVPLEEMATYRFEVEGDYLYVYDKDGKQITEPFWNESWTIPLHPDRHSVHFAGTWREFNAKEMYFHRDGSLARPYEKVGEGLYVNGERGKRIHAIAKGIDVSAWQYDIDWAQVARDDVDFAFVRVGITSRDELDPMDDVHYRYNLEEAARHGLKTGAYYYSRATTPEEAVAEADYLIEKLDGFKIDFPVVYDMEDEHQLLNIKTPQQFSAVVNAFNDRVREAGYHPMLYCNHHWLYYVMDRHALKDWDIWYAYWGPTVQDQHAIWQATSKGVVPGIDKNVVDINFLFKEDLLNLPARQQALK